MFRRDAIPDGIEVEGLVARNIVPGTRERKNGFDDSLKYDIILKHHGSGGTSRLVVLARGMAWFIHIWLPWSVVQFWGWQIVFPNECLSLGK